MTKFTIIFTGDIFFDAGAAYAVIRIIKTYIDDSDICEFGCRVLDEIITDENCKQFLLLFHITFICYLKTSTRDEQEKKVGLKFYWKL